MNITYHSWFAYIECPKKFYKQYVKKDPPTVPVNEYFTLYGRLVEKFFELYSNTWCHKTLSLSPKTIKEKMIFIYNGILKSSIVNWSAPFCKLAKEDIFSQAHEDICTIMSSPNRNYFLNTRSEVSIELTLKDSHKIRGRLDFIHKDPSNTEKETIFDGKGTDKIGKNIREEQLLFYSLLYYFLFKKLPIELGFFYYRFNTFIPVPVDLGILNEFRAKLSLSVKEMIKTAEHMATPSAKACKYCKYIIGCLEGQKGKAIRAKPSKIKDLEGEGLVEFGP